MPDLEGFALIEPGTVPQPFRRPWAAVGDNEARVRVAGCGLCHTDLGFTFGGVRTRHALPLILGHEIAGVVEDAGPRYHHLVGKAVVVPAVIPCGQCADCRDGFPMICKRQVMPGNDADGGFASHVTVPAHALCLVPGAGEDFDAPIGARRLDLEHHQAERLTLRHLAVIADAVSTPYQSVQRAEVTPGDLAIVVGLGGVGGYCAQLAHLAGASVVGLDVDPHRRASAVGCSLTLDPRGLSPKELRGRIADHARSVGARPNRWKIFECSGVGAGQATAFGLLVHGATLVVVGFTMEEAPLRLSNLMALDARALGNWGCAPELYPAIVDLALSGRLELARFTEIRPLSALPTVFEQARTHHTEKRIVFAPDL